MVSEESICLVVPQKKLLSEVVKVAKELLFRLSKKEEE